MNKFYTHSLEREAHLPEPEVSERFLLIVTCEPDDDDDKRLDYYSDNPWEGLLESILRFNTMEEIWGILAEYEGQFYQLFEMKHGSRLGYGIICDEYPESDIRQYENSLLKPAVKVSKKEPISAKTDSTGQLIVLSGFSQAGKDAIAKCLKILSSNYTNSVSVTTRAPRAGERNEVDYYFVTNDQFLKMKKHNAFLEDAKYCGHYYGTPALPVQKALQGGKNVILVLETEGAMKVKELFPQALTFFVAAPAKDILKRMEENSIADKNLRISQIQKESLLIPKYDYLIMNGEGKLEENVSLIHGIVTGNKQKTAAKLDTIEQLRKEFASGMEKETLVPAPCIFRNEDKTIFHVGDKIVHFKWEMNREHNVNDYIYIITGFPKNTETEEQYVAYRSVSHPEKEWVRPVEDFLSDVNREKYPDVQQKYRFVRV